MKHDESRNELGAVRIHKDVISSISSIAALEIEGVKRVGTNLKSSLSEFIGHKSFFAIKVDISRNEEVKVDIPLVIKYGYNIPDTASRVQENVHQALEKMSNLSVKDINVNVQGIERG
ncbi:MAG: Asp23/Gls24 family envelope stress response protein [Candidatus Omnitrophica bacterium]|nr:Asp23/Gls24 family envelope stress response protein [Candidatus Omnitrophota bacterium]MBU1924015.1 Asp23/Gls24 family envelope stress response protein [Candidatus Omnitrophota bacterium]